MGTLNLELLQKRMRFFLFAPFSDPCIFYTLRNGYNFAYYKKAITQFSHNFLLPLT